MSGVSGRREPARRLASSVTRQASVGASPGTLRVRRDGGVGGELAAATSGWIYDGSIRCSFGMTDPGTIAAGASGVSNTDGISFSGTPADYVDASTYLRTGLYIMVGTVALSGTAGDLVKVSFLVGNNQFDRFVTMTGSSIEYTFAETGPAAAGDPFIPWAVENLGANSIDAGPSGLGALYPIILP